MQNHDSVEKQLARDEALLAETRREIATTREGIQVARRQAEALSEQVTRLEEREATIEKRIALLRQYIEMAPPLEAPADEEPPAVVESVDEEEAAGYPIHERPEPEEPEEPGEGLLDLDEALAGNVVVGAAPAAGQLTGPPARGTRAPPDSFDDLDDESLSMELLPRTQTFEEEMLLILAHHRKAVEPKDVARLFRRLDHTPKIKPTEDNIKVQISSSPHFYEHTGEGRIALSQEGREEALRLLMSLV
jgi:hypothetical protein